MEKNQKHVMKFRFAPLLLFTTMSLTFFSAHSQTLYDNYNIQVKQLSDQQAADEKRIFDNLAVVNPLQPGQVAFACDLFPGPGYKCRLHGKQCCDICQNTYNQSIKSCENRYNAQLTQLYLNYQQKVQAQSQQLAQQQQQVAANKARQVANAQTIQNIQISNKTQSANLSNSIIQAGNVVGNLLQNQENQRQVQEETEALRRQEIEQNDENIRQIKQHNIDINNAIDEGNEAIGFKRPSDEIEASAVYYVRWFRADNSATVYICSPMLMKKYSDNTWPFFNDWLNAKKYDNKWPIETYNGKIYGFFTTQESAENVFNILKTNAVKVGLAVIELVEKDITPPKLNTPADFWNN